MIRNALVLATSETPMILAVAAMSCCVAAAGTVFGAGSPVDAAAPEAAAGAETAMDNLPPAFDWRDYGACTPIRSQVCSPASWAFSAIGSVESAILIEHGVRTDLSEQWLISCTDAGVEEVGSYARAFEFMRFGGAEDPCGGSGAVKEWDCYFHCDPPPCDRPYPHPYSIESWAFIGPTTDGIPEVEAIKQAILDHGPVSARVYASEAFIEYEEGVLSGCEFGPPDHSVMLVGWDDNQGREGVWILRNSWGTDWGEDGYMRIEYGCSRVGYGACHVTGVIRDCNGNGVPDDQDIADQFSEDCNENGIPDECDLARLEPGFTGITSWTTFNAGESGVGSHPVGYQGAVFDGRFIYFVPTRNGHGHSAELLRFDTEGNFEDSSSWASREVGIDAAGDERGGYAGGVFDGRYVYFAPDRDSRGHHGKVMRLDTEGDFFDESSWSWFEPGAHGVGDDPRGYNGAAFDGRYVYFAPDKNGSGQHGEVLRYDTAGEFQEAASWATFDAGDHGVGQDPDGYRGAIFDGQFVYFVPHYSGDPTAFEVLRYDTYAEFSDASSWLTYDPQLEGFGGSSGGAFDGRYVYFAPISGFGDRVGDVLRLDTTADFSTPSSWTVFKPAAQGVGHNEDAEFRDAVFDGRFVYFVPYFGDSGPMGEVLRYDTDGEVADTDSWDAYDAGSNAVGQDPDGYHGGAFDGRYVYFAPLSNDGAFHGEVLRYDTAPDREPDCNENGVPDECDIASGYSEDLNGNGIPDECEEPSPLRSPPAGAITNIGPAEVVAAWGRCSSCPEDVNGDGLVNAEDLFAVLAAFSAPMIDAR